MKGLIKNQPVFRGLHQAAGQRVIEFHPVADIDGLAGLDTVKGRRRPDAKPGTPEDTHEMCDVPVQLFTPLWPPGRPAGRPEERCHIIRTGRRHPALNPFISVWISVRIRAASLPLMRAMSS